MERLLVTIASRWHRASHTCSFLLIDRRFRSTMTNLRYQGADATYAFYSQETCVCCDAAQWLRLACIRRVTAVASEISVCAFSHFVCTIYETHKGLRQDGTVRCHIVLYVWPHIASKIELCTLLRKWSKFLNSLWRETIRKMLVTIARISKRSSLRRKTMRGALDKEEYVSGFGRLCANTPNQDYNSTDIKHTTSANRVSNTLVSRVKEFHAVDFSPLFSRPRYSDQGRANVDAD